MIRYVQIVRYKYPTDEPPVSFLYPLNDPIIRNDSFSFYLFVFVDALNIRIRIR